MSTQLQILKRKTQLLAALFFIKQVKATNNVRNPTSIIIIVIFIVNMIDNADENLIIVIIIVIVIFIKISLEEDIMFEVCRVFFLNPLVCYHAFL